MLALGNVVLPIMLLLLMLLLMMGGGCDAQSITFDVKRTVRHDEQCFTQGLQLYQGFLYESCGLFKKSSLRKVDPSTGAVLKQVKLPQEVFGEGLTVIGNRIYVITWKSRRMFVFDVNTFDLVLSTTFETFNGEGWGITHDADNNLIASDGSDRLSFLSTPRQPDEVAKKLKEVVVKDAKTGASVQQINELEYVNGYIYANLWYQDVIVKIQPETGTVVERIDLKSLYTNRSPMADCLNGIAYNESSNQLIITGKLWPKYFHVSLAGHFLGPLGPHSMTPINPPPL